jgi:hypothetical protein
MRPIQFQAHEAHDSVGTNTGYILLLEICHQDSSALKGLYVPPADNRLTQEISGK